MFQLLNILWMQFSVIMGFVNDSELFQIKLEHPVERITGLSQAA